MAKKNSTPTAQRSPKRQSEYWPPSLSDRSRWAYFMSGLNPDNDDAEAVARLSAAFGGQHPQWLIASNPARKPSGSSFVMLRRHVLRLTVAQCAAYLRISEATIQSWEEGRESVNFAAFEALRLLSNSPEFRISHRVWDGWFINPKTGELVSPDIGKLAVTPHEINRLPALYGECDRLRFEVQNLKQQIGDATAENIRLRNLFLVNGLTDELREMQDKLAALHARIATARIHEFQPSRGTEANLKEANAS